MGRPIYKIFCRGGLIFMVTGGRIVIAEETPIAGLWRGGPGWGRPPHRQERREGDCKGSRQASAGSCAISGAGLSTPRTLTAEARQVLMVHSMTGVYISDSSGVSADGPTKVASHEMRAAGPGGPFTDSQAFNRALGGPTGTRHHPPGRQID
jgi:hypothetical protein